MKTQSEYYSDALERWAENQETKKRADPTTLEAPARNAEFLSNRLVRTFNEGFVAGFLAGQQNAIDRLAAIIKGS